MTIGRDGKNLGRYVRTDALNKAICAFKINICQTGEDVFYKEDGIAS